MIDNLRNFNLFKMYFNEKNNKYFQNEITKSTHEVIHIFS